MHHVIVGKFSGPLELLLSLIQDKKMEIGEVSLSHVTEQFITYVEGLDEVETEELADFLVIATKLLLIKSKKLLSLFDSEEEEGASLEDQLRIYQMFVGVSKKMQALWVSEKKSYVRYEPPRIPRVIPIPENFTKEAIEISITKLLQRLKPPKTLPQTRIDHSISLKEVITKLKNLLEVEEEVGFFDIVGNKASKTEVIVSFLALLELVKQREVDLVQKIPFTDIMLKKI